MLKSKLIPFCKMADNRSLTDKKYPPAAQDQEATFVDTADKDIAAGHVDYHGIDTTTIAQGADEVYERKVAIMNEAFIDLGMGSFQWKIFALTGLGWFIDNVRILEAACILSLIIIIFAVLDASYNYHQPCCASRILCRQDCLPHCSQVRRPGRGIEYLADDSGFYWQAVGV